MTDWLVIGKIVSTQGIKGEVRVLSYSDFPERFMEPGIRWLAKSETSVPMAIELIRGRDIPGKTNLYVLKLAGIDTCDGAEAVRGHLLMVQNSDRPKLAENEYHINDLIGCTVKHQATGKLIGKVVDVLPGGNDLLEVENNHQAKLLIPFVEAIAPVVNIVDQIIEITPPHGLVDHWL